MELSINFIVTLIITIVVFALGIVFVQKIFKVADDAVEPLDEQTEMQLDNALARGEIVALPSNYKEIKRGSKEVLGFGLGISNQLQTAKDFEVLVKLSTAVDEYGNVFSDLDMDAGSWGTFAKPHTYSIENNGIKKIPLSFKLPRGTDKGTYVFNLYVCYGGDPENYNEICNEIDAPNLYDIAPQIRIKVV